MRGPTSATDRQGERTGPWRRRRAQATLGLVALVAVLLACRPAAPPPAPLVPAPRPTTTVRPSTTVPPTTVPTTVRPTTSVRPTTTTTTTTTSSTVPGSAPLPAGVRVADVGERGEFTDGVGAFRIVCDYSHSRSDDPIVHPGHTGMSHPHTFYGNTTTAAGTTTESLRQGSSTCRGGTANRSAYWVPAMLDDGVEVTRTWTVTYYKSGYGGVAPEDVRPMPTGLRIVAGEARRTTADTRPAYLRHTTWFCMHPLGDFTPATAEMQPCAPGWEVVMTVAFPQCWDGVRLDSADHISHMAYPDGGCPATHPVPIPAITINTHWEVTDSTDGWRLSSDTYDGPAGRSAHADWWNAWDPAVVSVWMTNCVQAGLDCHADLLGDGRRLV